MDRKWTLAVRINWLATRVERMKIQGPVNTMEIIVARIIDEDYKNYPLIIDDVKVGDDILIYSKSFIYDCPNVYDEQLGPKTFIFANDRIISKYKLSDTDKALMKKLGQAEKKLSDFTNKVLQPMHNDLMNLMDKQLKWPMKLIYPRKAEDLYLQLENLRDDFQEALKKARRYIDKTQEIDSKIRSNN